MDYSLENSPTRLKCQICSTPDFIQWVTESHLELEHNLDYKLLFTGKLNRSGDTSLAMKRENLVKYWKKVDPEHVLSRSLICQDCVNNGAESYVFCSLGSQQLHYNAVHAITPIMFDQCFPRLSDQDQSIIGINQSMLLPTVSSLTFTPPEGAAVASDSNLTPSRLIHISHNHFPSQDEDVFLPNDNESISIESFLSRPLGGDTIDDSLPRRLDFTNNVNSPGQSSVSVSAPIYQSPNDFERSNQSVPQIDQSMPILMNQSMTNCNQPRCSATPPVRWQHNPTLSQLNCVSPRKRAASGPVEGNTNKRRRPIYLNNATIEVFDRATEMPGFQNLSHQVRQPPIPQNFHPFSNNNAPNIGAASPYQNLGLLPNTAIQHQNHVRISQYNHPEVQSGPREPFLSSVTSTGQSATQFAVNSQSVLNVNYNRVPPSCQQSLVSAAGYSQLRSPAAASNVQNLFSQVKARNRLTPKSASVSRTQKLQPVSDVQLYEVLTDRFKLDLTIRQIQLKRNHDLNQRTLEVQFRKYNRMFGKCLVCPPSTADKGLNFKHAEVHALQNGMKSKFGHFMETLFLKINKQYQSTSSSISDQSIIDNDPNRFINTNEPINESPEMRPSPSSSIDPAEHEVSAQAQGSCEPTAAVASASAANVQIEGNNEQDITDPAIDHTANEPISIPLIDQSIDQIIDQPTTSIANQSIPPSIVSARPARKVSTNQPIGYRCLVPDWATTNEQINCPASEMASRAPDNPPRVDTNQSIFAPVIVSPPNAGKSISDQSISMTVVKSEPIKCLPEIHILISKKEYYNCDNFLSPTIIYNDRNLVATEEELSSSGVDESGESENDNDPDFRVSSEPDEFSDDEPQAVARYRHCGRRLLIPDCSLIVKGTQGDTVLSTEYCRQEQSKKIADGINALSQLTFGK